MTVLSYRVKNWSTISKMRRVFKRDWQFGQSAGRGRGVLQERRHDKVYHQDRFLRQMCILFPCRPRYPVVALSNPS